MTLLNRPFPNPILVVNNVYVVAPEVLCMTRNLNFRTHIGRHQTSSGEYKKTSNDVSSIKRHQRILKYMQSVEKHQKTSEGIERRQKASKDVNRRRRASEDIIRLHEFPKKETLSRYFSFSVFGL